MTTQGQYRALIGYLLVLILVVLSTGCGGGGGGEEKPPGGTTTSTDNLVIQAGQIPIVAVFVNETAMLNGGLHSKASTGEPLSFSWSFTSKPYGSNAQLQNATTAEPSFVADVAGTYLVQMVVSASGVSARDVATVLASEPAPNRTNPYTGPYNHATLKSYCVECHYGGQVGSGGKVTKPKSGDHLATSNMCQACHTTFGFDILPFVDHKEVVGRCSECHNGVVAIGKSNFHTLTTAECDDCHNTTSFIELQPDGSFDHSGIDRACAACHNGKVAIGKYEGHFVTNTDCGFCHTTVSFKDAYVDHSGFKAAGQVCAECHGVTATGPSPGHPQMSVDCGICHSVSTFSLDGIFNHALVDSISQPCGVCHDGTFAKGKSFKPDHEVTTADCAACHNTVAFAPAFGFDHSQFPEVVGDRCDRCHGNGNTGMHQNHIRIGDVTVALNIVGPPDLIGNYPTLDCSACHTPGTFASGWFDHANLNASVYSVVPVCSTCHDETHAIGKPVNHIVTDLECDSCHLNTDTFTGATVDHTSIIDGCLTCHDGNIAVGKPTVNHVPVDAAVDCSVCHAPYPDTNKPTILGFVPAPNFNHQGIVIDPQNCDACHNGRFTTSNGNLTGKPRTTHIPTQDDCKTCHTTDVFAGATFDHTNTTRGCEGCHNGQFTTASNTILGKPTDHIPTDQDCHICHNHDAGWLASAQTDFKHTGITGKCYTCHNGSYAAVGALGVADDPNTPDPHPQITVSSNGVHTPDCVACHSAPSASNPTVTFATRFVDHSGFTGNCTVGCHSTEKAYAQSTAHTSPTDGNDCELCHIGGGTWTEAVFDHASVPSTTRCDSCHNGTKATGKADKLARTGTPHVTTTEDCRLCHNTTSFAGAKFNHEGISSGCVDCHNGDTAIGKGNNHVPTNDDCYVCHQTTGFVPGIFAHTSAQISGVACESCHNGTFAIGKADKTGTPHIQTTQDCGVCHTTDTFVGGIFDHSNIGNQTCVSCHNGTDAKGQPSTGHIDSASYGLDCGRCHTAGGSFLGAVFDHNNIGNIGTGTCRQCHENGGGATEQPSGHFVTVGSNVDCDACHTTTGWGDQGTFDHCPNTPSGKPNYNQCGDYPGDHRAGKTSCKSCHNTNRSDVILYKDNTSYKPFCAGCHANDFRNNGDHNSGGVSNNQECGNKCHHKVNSSGF